MGLPLERRCFPYFSPARRHSMFFRWWQKAVQGVGRGSRRPGGKPARRRCRPVCELLESRLAPAVITVTTTADDLTPNDGSVSLREAITAVNAGNNLGDLDITWLGIFGTNDTIHFSISGAGVQTITLGAALPAIEKPLTIDGY